VPFWVVLGLKMKKLRLLMCSEASYLSSGFSGYSRELLKRLYASNKYEVAEFASYAKVNDPRDINIPWMLYANAPADNDPRAREYNNSTENQFGKWRFDRVLLDFKPDIVFDIRDYWMNSYQQYSPLRPYYHWVVMPTIDSSPQQETWIDTYISADALFTYSDFGRDVLLQQSNNHANYIDTASPGVDLACFHPIINEQRDIRIALGLPEDSFIIGTVVRNQKRKLIPDLFDALKLLQEKNPELYKKTYLYIHTSYPDAGWDIPQLLKEYNISNKVFFTYACRHCGHICSMLFSHVVAGCPRCGQKSMQLPSVNNGIDSHRLAHIINTFDLYVQYAICEGFGMPQVEAGACGIPLASVDYSAMNDVVHKLNGYPVRVQRAFKELETQAIRVYPDNNHFIEIVENLYRLPPILRLQKRQETRKLTELYYNWDDIAKKWEKYFDNVKLVGLQGQWDQPMNPFQQLPPDIMEITKGMTNYNFVYNIMKQFLPNHPIIHSIIPLQMIRDLEYGYTQNGMQIQPFTRQNVIDTIQTIISNHNFAQQAIVNKDKLSSEDYIKYAHLKANLGLIS
jgi:glycosyltransferase involved in cell wall biosynthesis